LQRATRAPPYHSTRPRNTILADHPIVTWPGVQRPMALGFLAYAKPGFGLSWFWRG